MKRRFFTFKNIFACLIILYALFMIFTTIFSDRLSAFNYRAFFPFLTFLVIGIVLLFKKNEPIEKKRIRLFLWMILLTAFAILIATVVSQQKQIKKLEKMEQSKSGIK